MSVVGVAAWSVLARLTGGGGGGGCWQPWLLCVVSGKMGITDEHAVLS